MTHLIRQLSEAGKTSLAMLLLGGSVVTATAIVGAGWVVFVGHAPHVKVLGLTLSKATPPSPSQPTITSGPTGTVTSHDASFTYTDKDSGVTFECALDDAAFAACPSSGRSYTGIADGAHDFQVLARSASGAPSKPTSRAWTVDSTPPVITPTFPADGGTYSAAAWSTGCKAAGLCGTATDVSGVRDVHVAIRQQRSGLYWNGSAFAATALTMNTATGTTSWRLSMSTPTEGTYVLSVVASDLFGNSTSTASPQTATFAIDTTTPPPPSISSTPTDPTSDTSAQFAFADAEVGVSFQCQLDSSPFSACSTGAVYQALKAGAHTFHVRALDAAGNTSAPASYSWTIVKTLNFSITGQIATLFAPGVTQSLDLVFTNPYGFAIRVDTVSIAVNSAPSGGQPSGCSAQENFVVSRAFTGPVIVPANATKSLSDLSTPEPQWPKLTMPDLETNQDACKNTTFSLNFTGLAARP